MLVYQEDKKSQEKAVILSWMEVGFSEICILNLRGKAFEFQFSPAESVNSSVKTNPFTPKMLKRFQMF